MGAFVLKDKVLTSEIIWAMQTVHNHLSCSFNVDISQLFARMFPDNTIAKGLSLGSTKCSYLISLGLAPYFARDLLSKLKDSDTLYVVSFDESLNRHIK